MPSGLARWPHGPGAPIIQLIQLIEESGGRRHAISRWTGAGEVENPAG
ncbi:hypothetical protein ACFYM7_35760 [Streptomyces cyaneofuscatus]